MNVSFTKSLYVVLERKKIPKSVHSILKFHNFGKCLVVELNKTFFIRNNLFIHLERMENTSNALKSYPPRKKGKFSLDNDPKKRSLTNLPVS